MISTILEFKPLATYTHPVTGKPIELSYKQVYDIHSQVLYNDWRFKDGEIEHETRMIVRWVYRDELKLLLQLTGFEKWDLYGDFDKTGFDSDSHEMIWVVEKSA